MKNISFVLLLIQLFFTQYAEAQKNRKTPEVDTAKINRLDERLLILETFYRRSDSIEYFTIYENISVALQNVNSIEVNYRNETRRLDEGRIYNKMIDINNPTSKVLGFKFSEEVIKMAEQDLSASIGNTKHRSLFSKILSKVVTAAEQPTLKAMLTTNPVGNIVNSIISFAATFTPAESKGLSNVETVSPVDTAHVKTFRERVRPYIEFYDTLRIASAIYIRDLERLEKKYEYLSSLTKGFADSLRQDLGFQGVSDAQMLGKINALLGDPTVGHFNYRAYLEKPEIVKANVRLQQIPVLMREIRNFRREYDAIFTEYISTYLKALENARVFMKTPELESLITELKALQTKYQDNNNEIIISNPKLNNGKPYIKKGLSDIEEIKLMYLKN